MSTNAYTVADRSAVSFRNNRFEAVEAIPHRRRISRLDTDPAEADHVAAMREQARGWQRVDAYKRADGTVGHALAATHDDVLAMPGALYARLWLAAYYRAAYVGQFLAGLTKASERAEGTSSTAHILRTDWDATVAATDVVSKFWQAVSEGKATAERPFAYVRAAASRTARRAFQHRVRENGFAAEQVTDRKLPAADAHLTLAQLSERVAPRFRASFERDLRAVADGGRKPGGQANRTVSRHLGGATPSELRRAERVSEARMRAEAVAAEHRADRAPRIRALRRATPGADRRAARVALGTAHRA